MKSKQIVELASVTIQTYLDDVEAKDGHELITALSVINAVTGAMIAKCVKVEGEQP